MDCMLTSQQSQMSNFNFKNSIDTGLPPAVLKPMNTSGKNSNKDRLPFLEPQIIHQEASKILQSK